MLTALTIVFLIILGILIFQSYVPSTYIAFIAISVVIAGSMAYMALTLTWVIILIWLASAVVIFLLGTISTTRTVIAILIMIAMVGSIGSIAGIAKQPTPSSSSSSQVAKEKAIAEANQILKKAGWKTGEYTLETVDKSKDKSTAGTGAINQQGAQNPADMVAFLKSGSDSANKLLSQLKSQTGATDAEILNADNWIAVQSKVTFNYPGNTMFKNGEIVNVGSRDGSGGDIFFLFKGVAVRGACINPQTVIPTPAVTPAPPPEVTPPVTVTPVTPPVTVTVTIPEKTPTPHHWWGGGGGESPPLTPKSSDITQYQRPGTGSTTDSGTGVKPVVGSTPVESKPATVVTTIVTPVPTQTIGNETVNSIVDTVTNDPGSETAVTAPGAAVPTSTSVPAPEPSVNPSTSSGTDTGTNTSDPGNPFE